MSKSDFIINNARVFTSDEENPQAEAVAVKGNRIVFVGTNEGAKEFQGGATRVIDGKGCTLTPGFIDSHFHLLWGSIWMGAAQLYDAKTKDDVRASLQTFAAENKTSEWVDGRGVKYGIVSTRQELDEIVPDRPVYINAYDGHTSWANTKALELAGILQPGKEAPGVGVIVRDENGLATGELRETAMDLVADLIPPPSEARKRELLKTAMKKINAAGVTSVHNMNGDLNELRFFAAVEDAGEMTVRVYVPYHVKPETTETDLREAVEMAKLQGDFARGGSVKFFMDGVWESYTALNLEPYADNPDANPEGIYSPEHFNRMAAACDKLGLQMFTHCCGDGAVRRALDGYEAAQKTNGRRDSRHRVEHIEVIHADDLPRFKQLGVIASMQPAHCPPDLNAGDIWPSRVGSERRRYSFAWRTLRKAGARQAYGSDWPVVTMNPFVGMWSGLMREPWQPGDPVQRLTLTELIDGYTRDAAYAEFQEDVKGMIRVGMLADLTLLDRDLFATPPEEIHAIAPVLTMVNGRIVFRTIG